ncbi:NAD-binding protein [Meridianimaribacter flavus]|uniref:NAD-binding protein n=1 Tax=Meridianimaribacter flavus TaxID=571115 RepID=UPI002938D96F|nr:NAD-binding protein [Meridianimaribacter flavus]
MRITLFHLPPISSIATLVEQEYSFSLNLIRRFLYSISIVIVIISAKILFEVYYGDATREDLLESAGIAEAKLLICATNKVSVAKAITKIVKEKYPHVELLVRTKNRYDAYELLNMDVNNIYRETLDTSLALASDALHKLGFRKYTLNRQVQNFIKYDEASLRRMAEQPRRDDDYIFKARKELEQQEKLLEADFKRGIVAYDNHWSR